MAHGGNRNFQLLRSGEYRFARGDLDLTAVNRQLRHGYSPRTALAGHTLLHVPQRMHLAGSISCFSYGFIAMASVGQCWAQIVQPMQSSVIEYVMRALHLPAGQRPWTCASYSSRKYVIVESTGFGAVLPG